ncbi:cupin domain-containing protein [Stenomitos frigidus]|uniref:cupin domain-containing protein n=1 Tax=Stenomitos frigidus TaxID=1886765 RepID=UPI003D6579E4
MEGYFPPGSQTPPRRHTRYSEQLYVLEGESTVWAGENKVMLGAGESFFIPIAQLMLLPHSSKSQLADYSLLPLVPLHA